MGLMSKIEDKLSGKHKTEGQALGSDSDTYGSNTNSGLTGSSTTGSGLSGNHGADSSLRHPVSGNQTTGLNHSGSDAGYGSGTNNNPLSSTTTTTNTTTSSGRGLHGSDGRHEYNAGSHNPLSSTTGGHGASHGISSHDHVDRDGYGTEQHPSLRDHQTSGSVPGAYPSHTGTGPASNTLGPHSSNAANVVDPRVQPQPERMKEHNTAGPHNSDMLNKADPRVDSDQSKLRDQDHHYGRDAALAGGAAGTAGYASHESGRHGHSGHGHSGHAQGFVPGSQADNPSAIPTAGGSKLGSDNDTYGDRSTSSHDNTVGPHKSGVLNKLDPRVDSDQSKLRDQDRLGHDNSHGRNEPYGTSGRHNDTFGPHGNDSLNRADPRVDSDNSHNQHHYGRDAAIGSAGVGAGAYGAEHLGRHGNDPSSHGRNETYGTSGRHNDTFGPHGNDSLNRVDPRVDSDNSHNQHHYGRDAAIGSAGVGAGAYGAEHLGRHGNDSSSYGRNEPYGTTGHHNNTAGPHGTSTMNQIDPRVDSDNSRLRHGNDLSHGSSDPYAPTGGRIGTAGPHETETANKLDPRVGSDNSQNQHHYGRDAAIGGAGAGAAMYGAEHSHGNHGTHGTHGGQDTYGRNEPYNSSSTHQKETVGPHKNNMLNKLDPRVDSDQSKLRNDDDLSRGTSNMSLNDRHNANDNFGNNQGTTGGYSSSNTGRY